MGQVGLYTICSVQVEFERGGNVNVVGEVVSAVETASLMHPPLPLVGDPIRMGRERQQNDSLADG